MSKTSLNYWAEFAVDIPLGLVLIFSSLRNHEPGLVAISLTILIGLFLFSFAEYAIHHWLFHGSIQILAQGHHAHHQNPLGYDSLPFFLPALILLTLTGTFVYTRKLCIFAYRCPGYRLCHLRVEPLLHPPPPFSSDFRPKLGSSSPHPSLPRRHQLWRYFTAVGYIVGHPVRVRS
jgi:hypothetical protein